MSKNIVLLQTGDGVANYRQVIIPITGLSTLIFDGAGNAVAIPFSSALDSFSLLPAAAVAAGADDKLLSLGTGTEVIARAAGGGVNVKTQATTPADNDNAMLKPVASSAMIAVTGAATPIRFSTRVNLTQVSELQFGAGLDENFTSPIGNATANDGAQFLVDPGNESATGIATYATNFILAEKVSGADTYLDSGVAFVAGQDYDLSIALGADLKPLYYINGVLVGTGAAALTSGHSLGAVIGVQINAASPAGQKDFSCRYVLVQPS